jgi:hypothetical protein
MRLNAIEDQVGFRHLHEGRDGSFVMSKNKHSTPLINPLRSNVAPIHSFVASEDQQQRKAVQRGVRQEVAIMIAVSV